MKPGQFYAATGHYFGTYLLLWPDTHHPLQSAQKERIKEELVTFRKGGERSKLKQLMCLYDGYKNLDNLAYRYSFMYFVNKYFL